MHALEIGGTPDQTEIASSLLNAGAVRVLQINNRSDLEDSPEGKLQYRKADARYLPFPEKSFDIIFGAAVLEHLSELDTILEQLYLVSRPGAIVCLHGGSFWNCNLGHHVWTSIDGVHYRFNDNNPLLDWEHLYSSREEMIQRLVESAIPESHAQRIAEWVYDSKEINRKTYEELVDIFNRSRFEIRELSPVLWREPDALIEEKLFKAHGNDDTSFSIGDAIVVLKKKFLPRAARVINA